MYNDLQSLVNDLYNDFLLPCTNLPNYVQAAKLL